MSTRFLWSVMTCGVLSVVGCAAAQVDEPDNDSGSGATSSTAGTSTGSGGGGSGGTGVVPKGGSTSPTGGTTSATAGTGAGGTGTGGSAGKAGSSSGGTSAMPPKPADTNLPYSEDFEDGEPNGFIPWNEDLAAGMWSVVDDAGGKVYQPAAAVGELEFAVGGSTSWTDVAFTVKVRLGPESEAQIVLRMKEPKTYLVVEMGEGKYKLRGRADGSTTDIVAPSPKPVITPGMWHTVGVTVKGSAVELTLDGTSIGTGTVNALISNGGIALGVAEGTVSFDDVSVTAAP